MLWVIIAAAIVIVVLLARASTRHTGPTQHTRLTDTDSTSRPACLSAPTTGKLRLAVRTSPAVARHRRARTPNPGNPSRPRPPRATACRSRLRG